MSPFRIIVFVIFLGILIRIVGFFTSSETAFLSLRKLKIRRMIQENKPGARRVAALKENIDTLLTTVLIGTNFVNSLTSALATLLAFELFGDGGVGFSTLVISFMITVFGQIVPKTIAGIKTEDVACRASLPIMILEKVFFPVVWLFSNVSHFAVFLVEKLMKPVNPGITAEEIKTLIQVGETDGTIEKNEGLMLNKIFNFSNITVNDIMHHRSFGSMVEDTASLNEITEEFLDSGYSVICVYHETMEDVIGIIDYKSVLYIPRDVDSNEKGYAKKLLKPVMFVPGTFSVFDLLKNFYSEKSEFAVVLDEAGGTSGVVTMKDVMTVVFGKMKDENLQEEIPPENRIKVISAQELLLPGDMKIEDVNGLLGLDLESDYYNTLGGWILEQFGHLPYVGQVLIHKKNLFIVEEQVNRRIVTVRIKTRT